MAAGAGLALAAIAGCTSSTAKSTGGSAGGGGNPVQLSPVAQIQAALSKASGDKTVHVNGTITSSSFTGAIDAQEQFGDNVQMSVNLTMSGTSISEIWLGNTLYLKIPQLSSELGGKAWAKLDLSAMGSLGSTFQSLIDSAKNTDPSAQLQPLLASGDVHKVGTDTVDGVQADHYSGTVDPTTAFESSQAAKNLTPAQITQLKSMMKDSGVTKETIDVWVVPGTGLPVRETISMNTSTGPVKVDMHLSDWGKPVTITAPPADQVGDLSSLMGGLGSTSG
jgi:hypothetical protein